VLLIAESQKPAKLANMSPPYPSMALPSFTKLAMAESQKPAVAPPCRYLATLLYFRCHL